MVFDAIEIDDSALTVLVDKREHDIRHIECTVAIPPDLTEEDQTAEQTRGSYAIWVAFNRLDPVMGGRYWILENKQDVVRVCRESAVVG